MYFTIKIERTNVIGIKILTFVFKCIISFFIKNSFAFVSKYVVKIINDITTGSV